MKKSRFSPLKLIAGGLIILGAVSCNNNPNNRNDTTESNSRMKHEQMAQRKDDSTFVTKANGINVEEIKLGKLAKDKGTTQCVKDLADMLVTDHTQMSQDLNSIAQKKSLNLSDNLNDDAQDAYDDLYDRTGTDFEKEYVDKMVKGHKDAISLFEKDSSDMNDADIRQYAVNSLPKLRKHLATAKNCQDLLDDMK